MSTFSRVTHIPAGCRAYSYFSSRSGGGRYFNSAKPPKAAVVAGKAGVPTNSKADPSVENKPPNAQCASQSNNNPSPSTTEPTVSQSVQHGPSQSNGVGSGTSDGSSNGNVTSSNQDSSSFDSSLDSSRHHIPTQIINAKDFKMHQFFAFHRPLLLISQPSSLFRELPSNYPLFNPLPPSEVDVHKSVLHALSGIEEPGFGNTGSPEAFFVDADAEAARQLTRALTMSKAAATISWEGTLKTLGLDVSKEAERVNLQDQFDKDWEDVMLDSTKRKRRKKMKKHKLKKRRRATRSQRLRLK